MGGEMITFGIKGTQKLMYGEGSDKLLRQLTRKDIKVINVIGIWTQFFYGQILVVKNGNPNKNLIRLGKEIH